MRQIVFILMILVFHSIDSYSQKRFITIDNTRFWINTIGIEKRQDNQPVIVFENGSGESMDSWDKVINDISIIAPVFTYDRAGIGKSEPIKGNPTLRNNSDRLRSILMSQGIKPPYILVGHSLGGFYICGYAKYYPDDLAGLIFVDPDDFTQTYDDFKKPFREIGLSEKYIDSMMNKKVANALSIDTINSSATDKEYKMLWELRLSDYIELKNFDIPQMPLYFLVGGRFSVPIEQRAKDYNQELLFRIRTKHWVENWTNYVNKSKYGRLFYSTIAGHYVQLDDPELVISSIDLILRDYKKMTKDKKQ